MATLPDGGQSWSSVKNLLTNSYPVFNRNDLPEFTNLIIQRFVHYFISGYLLGDPDGKKRKSEVSILWALCHSDFLESDLI